MLIQVQAHHIHQVVVIQACDHPFIIAGKLRCVEVSRLELAQCLLDALDHEVEGKLLIRWVERLLELLVLQEV